MYSLWLQVPNQDNLRLNPMGSKFSIPALLNLCSKSVGHKNLRSYLRTPTLVILVQLPLEWNTLLFNSDIVNFFWKTDEGETESIVLLMFVLLQVLSSSVRQGLRGGDRSYYLGPAEIASFSSRDLADALSMPYSEMLYRLDISTFYFYEPLLFHIFFPWKFIKT